TEYIAVAVGGASASAGDAPVGGTLVVLKLGGSAVKKLPTAAAGSGLVPIKPPSLKGFKKLSNDLYVDQAHKHAVMMINAAATSANSGFNFNGFHHGNGTFTVPVNWTVDWEFRNKASLPHSAAITTSTKVPLKLVSFGFAPVVTPNA